MKSLLILLLAVSSRLAALPDAHGVNWLAPYNIVWTEPATKALHSMPRAKDVVNWLDRAPSPPEPVLLSARKPITASSTYHQPGYDAAKANDNDLMTRWASSDPAREGTLAIDLGEEREIGCVWLAESDSPNIREFAIEAETGGGWKEIARGTTIGPDRMLEFPGIKTRQVRLHVLKAEGPININEFQVFHPAPPP